MLNPISREDSSITRGAQTTLFGYGSLIKAITNFGDCRNKLLNFCKTIGEPRPIRRYTSQPTVRVYDVYALPNTNRIERVIHRKTYTGLNWLNLRNSKNTVSLSKNTESAKMSMSKCHACGQDPCECKEDCGICTKGDGCSCGVVVVAMVEPGNPKVIVVVVV